MRGIVMEKNNDVYIVMTDDGQFIEVKNYIKTVEIGQEIELKNTSTYKSEMFRKIASVAAAIILFLSGGYGIFGHYAVYGYVDVDINPSVEISYNLYKRVLNVKGLNEDGDALLINVKDYKNKPIQVVVNKVIDSAINEEYIKDNEDNTVLITITEDKNEMDKAIIKEIDSHMKNKSIEAEVVVIKSDKKSFEDSKKSNLSPGKLKLIEKAAINNKNINPEEIKDKSVKEIMSMINQPKKDKKEQEKIDKQKEKDIREQVRAKEKENKDKDKEIKKSNEKNNKNNSSNYYSNEKNIKSNNSNKSKVKENDYKNNYDDEYKHKYGDKEDEHKEDKNIRKNEKDKKELKQNENNNSNNNQKNNQKDNKNNNQKNNKKSKK